MAYIDAANYNKIKGMRGFPIGTIIPWSGSIENIPKGWLSCTGNILNISTYPLLYECVGNTYGGTVGSTFGIPALNNRAIVDIFHGHYEFLKTTSSTYTAGTINHPMQGLTTGAWLPQLGVTKNDDLYWKQIGNGTSTPGAGGDTGSVSQTNHVSTMDLIGVRRTLSSNLTATVTGTTLSEGDYATSFNVLERKLGDGHWPQHSHGVTVTGEQAIGHSIQAGQQNCQTPWTGDCYGSAPECPQGQYAVDYRKYTTGQNHFRCGGGRIGSTTEADGNGCSGGDMLSAASGTRYFQTSLNQNILRFNEVIGHTHNNVNIKFTSRLISQTNFTINEVVPGDVAIDNTAGVDAATINMSSSTPTVAMIFIIKAF